MNHLFDYFRQAAYDIGEIRELVSRYFAEENVQKSVRDVRGLLMLGHRMSRAMGLPGNHRRFALNTTYLVATDVVVDEYGVTITDEMLDRAREGECSHEPLNVLEPWLAVCRSDDAMTAARRLARAQNESVRQAGELSKEDAVVLTQMKGGHAELTRFHTILPKVNSDLEEYSVELGYTIQTLDDYRDKKLDREEGITTPANCGVEDYDSIMRKIAECEETHRRLFGRTQASDDFFDHLRRVLKTLRVIHSIPGLPANHPAYPY